MVKVLILFIAIYATVTIIISILLKCVSDNMQLFQSTNVPYPGPQISTDPVPVISPDPLPATPTKCTCTRVVKLSKRFKDFVS